MDWVQTPDVVPHNTSNSQCQLHKFENWHITHRGPPSGVFLFLWEDSVGWKVITIRRMTRMSDCKSAWATNERQMALNDELLILPHKTVLGLAEWFITNIAKARMTSLIWRSKECLLIGQSHSLCGLGSSWWMVYLLSCSSLVWHQKIIYYGEDVINGRNSVCYNATD